MFFEILWSHLMTTKVGGLLNQEGRQRGWEVIRKEEEETGVLRELLKKIY